MGDKLSFGTRVYFCLFKPRFFEDETSLNWFFLLVSLAFIRIILWFDERRDEDFSCLDLFR